MARASIAAAVEAAMARLAATPVTSAMPAAVAAAAAAGAAPVICTHSGSFHCDEALAVGMLKLLPRFAASPVVRSRDAAVHAAAGVLVDVGAVYDPAALRFDHHQASFRDTYSAAHTIRLSSAGLIFKHFGRDVMCAILGSLPAAAAVLDDAATIDKLVARTYDNFVLELDAIDNGVEIADGPKAYRVSTGLASRVGHLNPAWNESPTEGEVNAAFCIAMQLATSELMTAVLRSVTTWLPARDIVKASLAKAHEVHPSGKIMVLDAFCPWKDHLFELEGEAAARGTPLIPVLYAVFADSSGSWRVQAVPTDPDSFTCRWPLPLAWAGMRDADLSATSGIPGGIFVHASRFIGGNKTREGAIAMAVASLEGSP